MPIELTLLMWTVILALAQTVLAVLLTMKETGIPYIASPRDEGREIIGLAGRLHRAHRNLLESLPLFAALVLIAVVIEKTNDLTAIGAHTFFWARVLYVPVYAAGIPWFRTLIWFISMVGIVLIAIPLISVR